MSAGRVLFISRDEELRAAIVDGLTSAGYDVAIRDEVPSLQWASGRRFDCTIIDQEALTGEAYTAVALCVKCHPVVLMADRPSPWLVDWVSEIVPMPAELEDVTIGVRLAMQLQA